MIKIKDVESITFEGELLQTSSREFAATDVKQRERLLAMSAASKIIEDENGPILMAGIVKRTYLSAPHLWVLLNKRFGSVTVSTMRALIELVRDAHGLETYIEVGNEPAERLAKAFGFEPTTTQSVYGHILFRLYRRP